MMCFLGGSCPSLLLRKLRCSCFVMPTISEQEKYLFQYCILDLSRHEVLKLARDDLQKQTNYAVSIKYYISPVFRKAHKSTFDSPCEWKEIF